jgi:hypothetical protein
LVDVEILVVVMLLLDFDLFLDRGWRNDVPFRFDVSSLLDFGPSLDT